MDYCEYMRGMIGNSPLIVVRPSVVILDNKGEILLSRYSGTPWGVPGGILQLSESVEECIKRNVKENFRANVKFSTIIWCVFWSGIRSKARGWVK